MNNFGDKTLEDVASDLAAVATAVTKVCMYALMLNGV